MVDKNIMLIADDLDINRDILREMFRNEFEILEAENGKECIDLVTQYSDRIKIILLDLLMPVMSGMEVLNYRKKDPVFSAIPVIVITVNDEIRRQMDAFLLGATDYITKPFIREVVIYRINNVLSAKNRLEEIAKEKRNLQVRAELDQMSGLYNKATVEKIISEKLAHNHTLSALLVIDIDDFKQVNDRLGHLEGDHAIRIIADLISGHFRKTDTIGRVGGDEFIVYMENLPSPAIATKKAYELAELLRYKPNLTVPANVSVSIGVAITQRRPYDYEELFSQADKALYCAKENGKGRYAEYGEIHALKASGSDKEVMLLLSRSRAVCGSIRLAAEGCRIVEILSTEYQPDRITEEASLLLVDISMEPDQGERLLKKVSETEWLKNIPFISICKEGKMEQFAAALKYHTRDIITVPVDIEFAKKRIRVLL